MSAPIDEIEEVLEENKKKEILALFEQFKELNVDQVGIGNNLKAQSRKFDINQWPKRKNDYSILKQVAYKNGYVN
ncbi:Ger(x)C family spore germination C-terminal domain-containing protein [Metabacillus fastidiosus]|uniref:Ger(x)C family spore germination C-terminal domain-containing protein n=1 Tax=Metabacillus fastidiosus TaxID=1458 RepID=UPI002E23BA7B|nr:Ger(x)C family spore germination C-terminal domain-containing protein [Metabacillus fastidiosus]MED4452110.1 Ger(x)C family spore germination C-terminal domain-containing protein [Metabacillus fastidiosus]